MINPTSMAIKQDFDIESVLMILTGIGFTRGLSGPKNLIHYMTGEPATEFVWLAPHGGRLDLCKGKIASIYPELSLECKSFASKIDGVSDRSQFTLDFLNQCKAKYGNTIEIERLDPYPEPPESEF